MYFTKCEKFSVIIYFLKYFSFCHIFHLPFCNSNCMHFVVLFQLARRFHSYFNSFFHLIFCSSSFFFLFGSSPYLLVPLPLYFLFFIEIPTFSLTASICSFLEHCENNLKICADFKIWVISRSVSISCHFIFL